MHQRLEAHDLTDRELEESYWLVTHWKKIEKASITLLYAVAIASFLFALALAGKMYLIDRSGTVGMTRELNERVIGAIGLRATPISMDVQPVMALARARGTDLLAIVRNPNDDWKASFDLVFSANGTDIAKSRAFVYPGRTKHIVRQIESGAENASVRIANLAWSKLTSRELAEIPARRQFAVENISFESADGITRTRFTVTNESVYSYWNVEAPVVLIAGSAVVAADTILLDHLNAGESRTAVATWTQTLPEPSSTIIEPDVDIFDPTVYREGKAPLQRLR